MLRVITLNQWLFSTSFNCCRKKLPFLQTTNISPDMCLQKGAEIIYNFCWLPITYLTCAYNKRQKSRMLLMLYFYHFHDQVATDRTFFRRLLKPRILKISKKIILSYLKPKLSMFYHKTVLAFTTKHVHQFFDNLRGLYHKTYYGCN